MMPSNFLVRLVLLLLSILEFPGLHVWIVRVFLWLHRTLVKPKAENSTFFSILLCGTGEWRRLHNEELNDLFSSPNIVRVIKSRIMSWAEYVVRMGEERGVYRVLVGKSEGKRALGKPMRRWVGNIRMDLQEVGCGYMDWIGLTQDRYRWPTLVSAVMNLRVPWNAGNFLTSFKSVSFSRRTLHHAVSKYEWQRINYLCPRP